MEKLSAYAFPSDSDEFLPPTPPPVRLCQAFRSSSRSMTAPAPSANLASTRRSARQERGPKRGSASQPLPQLHYKDWTTPKLLKLQLLGPTLLLLSPFLFLLRIRKTAFAAQLPPAAQSTQPQHLPQSLTPPIPSSSSAPQVTFNQLQTLLQPIIDSQLALSALLDKLENPALAPPAFSSSTPAYTLEPSEDHDDPDSLYGVTFTRILKIVKGLLASLLEVIIDRDLQKNCAGCAVDHPSQRHHSCLFEVDYGYFNKRFEELIAKIHCRQQTILLKQHPNTLDHTGPNGVPYRVYKSASGVLRILWKLMKVAWEKQVVPRAWRRAGGVFIPKEKDSTSISQFRPISLLNVEGKIFFSIIAQRLSAYILKNCFIDTSIQKAGIPGFPGCLEHINVIWQQIQSAKKERKELHVTFLDLANAYGSVPHELLRAAFDFFSVPMTITNLVKAYFGDLQFSFSTSEFSTTWQCLEVGIMAGCTISPLAFTMAMEVIIRASKWVVGGERLASGMRLPPIRAYMDDMTTMTTTVACTNRLLGKLTNNIEWARMQFKPTKSRSISIIKGKVVDKTFFINGEAIPTVSEKPVKSLGRWYDGDLKDTVRVGEVRQQAVEGLKSIDSCALPGKLKLWCFQFGLLPRLLWPLTVYEVSLTTVEKLEALISSYIRKWLGVPRCLSRVGLYGKGILQLPVSALTEEFKCAKVRLEMTLVESRDKCVREAAPVLKTGRKWAAKKAVEDAKAALRIGDIMGQVQHGRGGLGFSSTPPTWHKAAPAQYKLFNVTF
ncbi:uncharacterized protein LOC131699527 [Acipenser ruthenus]|uniref:uncharacterized protein LOC131699527 n=1 Tax=Acipenser ruthenus TaxID=7906 RepID=UPI002740D1FD|nr:uncharacterized protein LOC131699527 [Acipenser ruthenus]